MVAGGDGVWVYLTLGWLLPVWRGQGIGTAMLHWTEARIRTLAATLQPPIHGEPGGAKGGNAGRIEFAANASSTEYEATALLRAEGYIPRYTMLELVLDATVALPDLPLPAGLVVRPVQPAHYRAIAASVYESYRDAFDHDRFDEIHAEDAVADYVAGLQGSQHDPTLWQVAWDSEQVAAPKGFLPLGQVLSVIEQGQGRVFDVAVRHAWRRRGLARTLLVRAVRTLRERGIETIRLHTNADFKTRAIDLYESVGFRVRKEFPRYRKPFDQVVPLKG